MSTDNIKDLLKNPEQIKQMIGLLSALLESTSKEDVSDDETDTKTEAPAKKPTIARTQKTKKIQRENKFLSMPEVNMHKEDPDLAQKLYKQPPVARSRKLQMVNVRCRVCGKEEKVQASLLYGGVERFKCNKCSATPG
jgi:hypothetical protein